MADDKILILQVFKVSEEPLRAGQVAETTGIDKDTVGKMIKILVKEGELYSPKRCFYASVE